ncbi:GNAT family N-acetyltransferase [Streptosporangium sp. NPDC051023]|uniref:GNAT family N-acetyltransferase n=1 Tax=Streptosporangium sp. NPDC051023 TaxID=3155410 RepID=UPI00344C45DD
MPVDISGPRPAAAPRPALSPASLARSLVPTRARLAYTWNNSPSPAWRAARRLADTLGGSVPMIASHTEHGDVSIAYLGLPIGQANILQLLEHQRAGLGLTTAGRETGSVRWRDLAEGRWPDADLVVVGAEARRLRGLPPQGGLTAPFRVHLVVDVPGTEEELQQRISKRERWQFRRNQREHQWTLEEDSSPEALDFFYRRMHLPTMHRRHGDRSRTESLAVARHAILRQGTIFFVTLGGTRVAGALCHWSEDRRTLTTRLLGVLDGRDEHYEKGAFKAVYHLLLRWACANRVPRVDFFGTEAFVSKGIFQWKRKFAPRVELPPNHFATKRMRLYVRRDTPAVRDFLVANPLLRIDRSHALTPVYFTDAGRPPRLDISAQCPGLPEPEIVDLDAFLSSSAGPGETSDGVPR